MALPKADRKTALAKIPRGKVSRIDPEAEISAMLDRLIREDADIVRMANRACELEDADLDETTPPAGFTRKEWRVARDGRLSTQNAPIYLKLANKRVEHRADRSVRGDINIERGVVLIGSASPTYDVKVIEKKPGDD